MRTLLDSGSAIRKDRPDAAEAGRLLDFARRDPSTWPTWLCPDCGLEMARMTGVPESLAARRCYDCDRAARPLLPAVRSLGSREEELLRIGVPERHARIAFEAPAVWPADRRGGEVRSLEAWRGEPWCATLAGVVGGGKTLLAVELAWRAIQRRAGQVCFHRAGTAVAASFGDFGEERKGRVRLELYEADVLVLDEIGRGHDGGAWARIVEVLSHRHEHLLATICTTNRRLRPGRAGGDREISISDQDAGLMRRLEDGLLVGLLTPWAGGVA